MLPERSFTEACHNYLHSQWDRLLERIDKNQYIEPLGEKLFVAQKGVELSEKDAVEQRIASEFISGQNVYITDLLDFARSILLLLGEQGRVDFISRVGMELDRVHSAISHRKAWAVLLKTV